MTGQDFKFDDEDELSLLETLDHVLDRGLVIAGEVTIAVADIDLVYIGLNLLLGSVETVNKVLAGREGPLEIVRGRVLPAHEAEVEGRDEAP